MAGRDPFHEGEVAVQVRTGERGDAARRASMIRDSIMPQAWSFLRERRTIAIGATDDLGRPWASLRLGAPGFAGTDDGTALRVSRTGHTVAEDDPTRTLLRVGRDVGVLAIDLASRRRLRINGVITAASDAQFEVGVREVFPNCTKYIQQRDMVVVPRGTVGEATERGERLDERRRSMAASVDTLFVASRHPTRGADVSHRGGNPGFVRVVDERTLRFPDYPGNGMFQTLGNFEVYPHAGVLMVDFARGRFLSLTGRTTVLYDVEDSEHPSGGTARYWDLSVQEWIDFAMPADARFRLVSSHPGNPVASNPGDQVASNPGQPVALRSGP